MCFIYSVTLNEGSECHISRPFMSMCSVPKHKIPEDWSIGITHPIHKKGDKLECSNYRAITLLNVTYKVLSGILYNRLAEYAEEKTRRLSMQISNKSFNH